MKAKLRNKLSLASANLRHDEGAVGVDTSKATLDAYLIFHLANPVRRKFANSPAGFRELLEWCVAFCPKAILHFCMEATGPYSYGLACFLRKEGLKVSVVNPTFIKHFGAGEEVQNKTDKVDAAVIALYCLKNKPKLWEVADEKFRELNLLTKRHGDLQVMIQADQNRLEDTHMPHSVEASILRNMRSLSREQDRVHKHIQKILEGLPERAAMIELLTKEPGVGEKTALHLLNHFEWGITKFEGAQQAAAALGINPVVKESGTFKGRTMISRRGPRCTRAEAYMATVAAIRCNPKIRDFYESLLPRLSKKAALLAACRKFVMTLYGILKAHIQGKTVIYHGEKLRYTNFQGKQKAFKPQIPLPEALTI